MNKKTILLLCTLLMSMVLFAQNKDLIIEFTGKQTLKKSALVKPEKYSEICDYNDSTIAFESPFWAGRDSLTRKRTITFNNKQFDVETLSETKIAHDAGILVKYGSGNPLNYNKRHDFKVIYYDLNKGSKLFELPEKYEGAGCSLSKNGFLAMTGGLLGHADSEGAFISLYDKKGKELFTKALGPDNWPRDIHISPNGNYIALVYSTLRAHPPKDRFNLMILKNDGTILLDKQYINCYFHHLIFSPSEDYFLGFAYNYICLFDIKDQKLKWEQNINYQTGKSPAVFLKDFNCILIQSTLETNWTSYLIDIDTGKEIFKIVLPDKQSPFDRKTLFQKNKDEFIIESPNQTYNFKIRHKK
jgi:hypothetical protein